MRNVSSRHIRPQSERHEMAGEYRDMNLIGEYRNLIGEYRNLIGEYRNLIVVVNSARAGEYRNLISKYSGTSLLSTVI